VTELPVAQEDSAPREEPAGLSTYAYSYPHKSSYRPLTPPVSIAEAWRGEDVDRLSLYVHIPFCEMRCGFCNLFTQSRPDGDFVAEYLSALLRQMRVIRDAVTGATFRQFAIGGGTPTFMDAASLDTLLRSVESAFGVCVAELPASIESSPATATPDRLRVLADFGVRRISLGVQSFSTEETRLFGRPQDPEEVHRAISAIRRAGPFELNLDLIYGHPDQTSRSWRYSLDQALRHQPDEIYLYPLYVRPETGLARRGMAAVQHRRDLYREARDRLSTAGYERSSLRCFRRVRSVGPSTHACQRDGMIGLGCGARSYTRELHYATRYAVTQAAVRAILGNWIAQSDLDFAFATHGVWLTPEEQRRRYVILSLLQSHGMSRAEFAEQFPEACLDELSGIAELRELGWLIQTEESEKLTPAGLEHSDEVGPLLYSDAVRARLRDFIAGPRTENIP
jgi:oxygen-independent coproporphyrinogen III oxidase